MLKNKKIILPGESSENYMQLQAFVIIPKNQIRVEIQLGEGRRKILSKFPKFSQMRLDIVQSFVLLFPQEF